MNENLDETISCCGLNCRGCAIYLATREQDEKKRHEMRVEIAQQIKELYGEDCKPEDVTDCDGCRAEDDRLLSGSKKCYMRKCVREKRIENCAYCDEYSCEKLEEFFAKEPQGREHLDKIRSEISGEDD